MLDLKINEFGYTEQKILFKDLKYNINNQKCIISGPNGSGKTTLSLILSGIIPHLHKCYFKGALDYKTKSVELNTIISKFHYQFQNPSFNFLSLKVSDILCEKDFSNSFKQLYPTNSINYNQSIASLSTGQKQQLSFFDSLNSNKELVFLDEPFSFLDSKSIANSIFLLNETLDKSFIIINHIKSIADSINNIHEISLGENNHFKPIHFKKNKYLTEELLFKLDFSNFSFQWHKINVPNEIIINRGEIIGLFGDNGTGKTTLARNISGLANDKVITNYMGKQLSQSKKRKLIKLAFQDVDYQIFQNDIMKELYTTLNIHFDKENVANKVNEFNKYFYSDEIDPFKMSYGQKKLFIILLIYLLEPELLILDEPFSSLDNTNSEVLNKIIEKHLAQGKAIILTSHNINILETYANKIIYLK